MTHASPGAHEHGQRSPSPVPTEVVDRLAEAVGRLAGALRRLDPSRLARPPRRSSDDVDGAPDGASAAADGASVAELAHRICEELAAVQRAAGDAPSAGDRPVPVLPRLADHAAGDQVAVVGRDAVLALRREPGAVASERVADLAERLRSLRLRL